MLEEPIELEYRGKTILGIKHHANSMCKKPCVIFVHGIPGDRVDAKRLHVKIARKIQEQGFSSVRFDFLAYGVSPGNSYEYTLLDQLNQIKRIINKVVTYGDNDGKVILIAFSEAAKIAAKIAMQDKRVVGLCFCNGIITEEKETIKINRFYKEAGHLVYDINYGVWLNKKIIEESKEYTISLENLIELNNIVGIYGYGDELVINSLKLLKRAHKKVILISGADHLYTRYDWEVALINNLMDYLKSYNK